MIASHRSAEPCGSLLLDALGLHPFITAQMRLGEGSGAVAAMPMLDMALSIYRSMSTFGDMGLAPYQHQN
jgi:nicotinate-nucleotide--dimethylbenzimidazole phosphoribosyltransferase